MKKKKDEQEFSIFKQLRDGIFNIDPVTFCEQNLCLDGNNFSLTDNGYKPFSDIYRYIGLKAIEKNAKPVVMVKGRQVGATTMAAALECYFMACGLFGNNGRAPMRIGHLFPTLGLAAMYTKTKLDPMISSSKPVAGILRQDGTLRSFMETKLDTSSPANDNLQFKLFKGGNQIFIESTGIDGDRIRGRQLSLDTELPTPNGFITLAQLKEGDQLFDENGNICNVIKMHSINLTPEAYKITFDDGTVVEACAEHLWATQTKRDKLLTVRNTREILNTLGENHYIPVCLLPPKTIIDPHLLDVWRNIKKSKNRFIKNIESIPSKPMRCITVDSPSHLYLITRSFIPTHNTMDCAFFDECFPYDQNIETEFGKEKIGKIYDSFVRKEKLPLVKTYNEVTQNFEYKKIKNAWCRGERELIKLTCANRKIECTPNHRFLTAEDGWKMAVDLRPGDLLRTTNAEINQISNSLNDDQLQVILGSFLGDGHISSHGSNKYRIREVHGIKQRDYCKWKASIFNSTTKIIDKNGYSQKPALTFSSKLFAITKQFPKIKTTCPQWVLDGLDARGLAIWFMDDGSVYNNHCGGVIHTCSFDEDSQKRIVNKLQSMGIDCDYRFYDKKESGYFSIYLNKSGYLKLCDIIRPYIHKDLFYKVSGANEQTSNYNWNNKFNNYGLIPVNKIELLSYKKNVYDIEVEDNHNFIVTSVRRSKKLGGLIAHNCQDIPSIAVGAVTKVLAQSHYGFLGEGVQVYFGTPKQKGSNYYNMWKMSHQHYFHLRCEKCKELFPLYRPDVNWEEIWLYGYVVRCTNCKHEQDKRQAAENGKWLPVAGTEEDSKYIGYHINQLYIPTFTKETILGQKPEKNPNNTERIYQNEVLGEFYDGEGALISPEEIHEKCADMGRFFTQAISPSEQKRVYAGFDWGQKGALDQLSGRQRGQSYSCGVILTAEANDKFIVEFATRLKRNDIQTKLDVVDEMFRRYSVHVGVGDIGDAYDLTHILQKKYHERFIAARAAPKVIGHIKYVHDIFPREIVFERDYYYSELIGLLKSGSIRFPYGSYDMIAWLINHCCSMDIRVNMSRQGDPVRKYVKGPTPNDGFTALLNAYLAYKWHITQRFTIKQPLFMKYDLARKRRKIPAILGYMPKWR
jgi:hypothetical protein